jgi:hypothetical protein
VTHQAECISCGSSKQTKLRNPDVRWNRVRRGHEPQQSGQKIKGTEGLHTISALTHRQAVELLEHKVITAELFDEEQIVEVFDPEELLLPVSQPTDCRARRDDA